MSSGHRRVPAGESIPADEGLVGRLRRGGPGRARRSGELGRWRASSREARLVGGGVGAPHKPWEGRQEAVEGWDEGLGNQGSV